MASCYARRGIEQSGDRDDPQQLGDVVGHDHEQATIPMVSTNASRRSPRPIDSGQILELEARGGMTDHLLIPIESGMTATTAFSDPSLFPSYKLTAQPA